MSTAEVRSQAPLDELLKGVAQLETPELERFVSQVLTLRAQRPAPYLSEEEARLLEKISQGLPPEDQQRYDELTARRRTETLGPEEHQQLLALTDQVEQADAERAQALVGLAQRRQTSVLALMTEMGIRPPRPE